MDIAGTLALLPKPLRRHCLARLMLRLSPTSRIQQIRFNGDARCYADISDPFIRNHMLTGRFEPEFFAAALPFVSDGGAFFDVGANFGLCTFGLLNAARGRRLECHAFEPNPAICDVLKRSVRLHRDACVRIVPAAIGAAAEARRFQIVPENIGASHLAATGTLEVPTIRLDDYIAEHRVKRVDLLKIDAEGWEPFCVEGAMASLKSGIIRAAYFEMSPDLLARTGWTAARCLDLWRAAACEVFYVKSADVRRAIGSGGPAQELQGARGTITVSPCRHYSLSYASDLLAVHQSALPDYARQR